MKLALRPKIIYTKKKSQPQHKPSFSLFLTKERDYFSS